MRLSGKILLSEGEREKPKAMPCWSKTLARSVKLTALGLPKSGRLRYSSAFVNAP